MAGIAAKIKIYNEAYKIVWAILSDNEKMLGSGKFKVSELVGNHIRLLIRLGRADAAKIASETIASVLGPIQTPAP